MAAIRHIVSHLRAAISAPVRTSSVRLVPAALFLLSVLLTACFSACACLRVRPKSNFHSKESNTKYFHCQSVCRLMSASLLVRLTVRLLLCVFVLLCLLVSVFVLVRLLFGVFIRHSASSSLYIYLAVAACLRICLSAPVYV